MGFNTADVSKVPWSEHGFLAPIGERIKREVGVPVALSWNIHNPQKAQALVEGGRAAIVMLGKALLDDPHGPYHAAQALGAEAPRALLPEQAGWWLRGHLGKTELS